MQLLYRHICTLNYINLYKTCISFDSKLFDHVWVFFIQLNFFLKCRAERKFTPGVGSSKYRCSKGEFSQGRQAQAELMISQNPVKDFSMR